MNDNELNKRISQVSESIECEAERQRILATKIEFYLDYEIVFEDKRFMNNRFFQLTVHSLN